MPAHEECNQPMASERSAVTLHATVGLVKRNFVIWYREQPTSRRVKTEVVCSEEYKEVGYGSSAVA